MVRAAGSARYSPETFRWERGIVRRLLSIITLSLAAALVAQAGTGPALAAAGFDAGPSRSVGATFESATFFGEIIAVDTTTLTSDSLSTTQTMNACIAYGRVDSGRLTEGACGPVTVSVDYLLDSGRVTGSIPSSEGLINIDLTVTGMGQPSATVSPFYDAISVAFTAAVARPGDATGVITVGPNDVLANAGSSWYGQLVEQATAEVRLP